MKHKIAIVMAPLVVLALLGVLATDEGVTPEARAYTFTGASFGGTQALYKINANFPDASAGTAEQQRAALQRAASEWKSAAQINFEFVYDGETTMTTVAPSDGTNTVFYSNTDGGGALATATWSSIGGNTIGFDIRFYDRWDAWDFVWAVTPTFSQFDIESVAVHEFGHALGLGHSTVSGASMFASVSAGNTQNRTLHADDIDGAVALYGVDATGAPTVSSVTPDSGWIAGGTRVTVTGTEICGGDPQVVTFDGIAGTDVAVLDNTRVAVTVPMGINGGAVDVDVSHAQGSGQLDDGFTNEAMRVVEPLSILNPGTLEVLFPGDAGLDYKASPAISNTPGFSLTWYDPSDSRIVPLNPDGLFYAHGLGQLPAIVFQNFSGTLDGSGGATLTVDLPAEGFLLGYPLSFATVTLDAGAPSGIRSISQPFTAVIDW